MDAITTKLKEIVIPRPSEKLVPPPEDVVVKIRAEYSNAGQEHVLSFYDHLSVSEKIALIDQLRDLDPQQINKIFESVTKDELSTEKSDKKSDQLEPLPREVCSTTIDAEAEELETWRDKGLELIGRNKVAVVVLAGGQGTRLGSSDPKGCFDIGLPSHKSLFQIQAERIIKLQRLARKHLQKEPTDTICIPWYIMTSAPTRTATVNFFNSNTSFGLNPSDVMFFDQGTLPCVDNTGKMILEELHKVAVAPDGNGGLYRALITGNVLADMGKRGIEHVHVYCVDNCLVKVADPLFLGWAELRNLDIGTKVVRKRDPKESVGITVLRDGKPDVVEYSEIDTDVAAEKETGGLLKYRAGNIVNHYFSYRFLSNIDQWEHALPYHVAKKKIPFCDLQDGERKVPEAPNGIKMEQFVFDVFPLVSLNRFGCFEIARTDEFSPLKNKDGEDSPASSRRDVLEQGRRWIEAAGGRVVSDGSKSGNDGVEISPLVSYAGEGSGLGDTKIFADILGWRS